MPSTVHPASGPLFVRKLHLGRRLDLYNRELSWLDFNERVLQEAENSSTPLGERLNFMSIFSSNMDEFFRVRVATQQRLLHLDATALRKLDFHPRQVLEAIHHRVQQLQERFESVFQQEILPSLRANGVVLADEDHVPPEFESVLHGLFKDKVQPFLNPIMLDRKTRQLRLRDAYLYLAIRMEVPKKVKSPQYALLELPVRYLQRFYALGQKDQSDYILFIDDLVRLHLHDVFERFHPTLIEAYTIKMTRDQELDLEQDVGSSLLDKMQAGLLKRGKGEPVRFLYDQAMPEDLLELLVRKLKIKRSALIAGGRYHNFKDLRQIPLGNRPALFYPAWKSCSPGAWSETAELFKAVRAGDRLLHHPYQSYDIVLRFLREAALDPQVVKIEITLYRLATISSVARSLITAALNGKQVKALVEIQARFDEENNIYWAEKLQEAGAEVLYGFEGYKVHSKMCLITRVEKGKKIRYAHLSTGNYNAQTAKIYADDGLLTASPVLTSEVSRLFKSIYKGQFLANYKHLMVAPLHLRNPLLELIEQEIQWARKGMVAWIFIKLNSLVDESLIAALYKASQAGVRIRGMVRGVCSLIPGIPALSDRIEIRSIIDRYLEHSRVYAFGHGGAPKVFLSSADWMGRNMDHRVELAFPLLDPANQQEMMNLMELQWQDTVKARYLNGERANQTVGSAEPALPKLRAQEAFHAYLGDQNRTH